MRFFTVGGVCDPERHYMLPPERRVPSARGHIDRREYFAVHAPQQTGKTTTLRTLARNLTAEGRFAALTVSCGRAAGVSRDSAASTEILSAISSAAQLELPERLRPPAIWSELAPGRMIYDALRVWAIACPLPLVLLLDEIDSLQGEVLRSVLHQLRDGHKYRSHAFPASVVVCGMRDVRDCRAASGGDPDQLDGLSPFNVAVDSLQMADFTADEVAALYTQHTADTGQKFTAEAVEQVFDYSQGQPWLVNAIAREITDSRKMAVTAPVTAEHVGTAKERLLHAKAFHLVSLADKLRQPRLRRVIEPIIVGTLPSADAAFDDDVSYALDLGLIARDDPLRIANSIYREMIVRVLAERVERGITADPRSLVLADGRLDVPGMLAEFTAFWLENGERIASDTGYREAGAQIVFMAFLHIMSASGDGYMDHEFGVGTGRTDILIRRRYGEGKIQREAFELKVWWDGHPDPLVAALTQFDDYLARFQLDGGTLIIFDCCKNPAPVEERLGMETIKSPGGRAITLLRR